MTFLRMPLGLRRYNIQGVRNAYDVLAHLPPQFNQSYIIFEGYSCQAVRAIPAENTAFPERHNDLLIAPFMIYAPEGDARDREAAIYGERMRDALRAGQPLEAYVNYALGTESQEALYGYEPWRLEKMRRLKREFDPNGKFSFYNGIR
jgi:hypothetical protein